MTILVIAALSLTFALLCAAADWAVPRLVTLRRRRRIIAARQTARLAPLMSEEYRA